MPPSVNFDAGEGFRLEACARASSLRGFAAANASSSRAARLLPLAQHLLLWLGSECTPGSASRSAFGDVCQAPARATELRRPDASVATRGLIDTVFCPASVPFSRGQLEFTQARARGCEHDARTAVHGDGKYSGGSSMNPERHSSLYLGKVHAGRATCALRDRVDRLNCAGCAQRRAQMGERRRFCKNISELGEGRYGAKCPACVANCEVTAPGVCAPTGCYTACSDPLVRGGEPAPPPRSDMDDPLPRRFRRASSCRKEVRWSRPGSEA